jgi:hypothetical protein
MKLSHEILYNIKLEIHIFFHNNNYDETVTIVESIDSAIQLLLEIFFHYYCHRHMEQIFIFYFIFW